MNWVSHFQWNYWVNITSTTLITATLALLPNELMVATGVVIRRSGSFEFLTPLISIDDVSIEPDLKINKKCLRNINAPWCKIQKDCIYAYTWIIQALVATIVPGLVIIKQMVHIILSGQCWNKDQNSNLDLVTQKVNRDNFLSKANQCSKFGNHQSKGHKI